MLPALASLIALQELDTAAETARRRIAEMPGDQQRIDRALSEAAAVVDRAKERLAQNHQARRDLEKRVAVVDSRLARFDEHKAAVKTNQEYTALLHEIETAKAEKDALEEQILMLLEEADGIGGDIAQAEQQLAEARRDAEVARATIRAERDRLEAEIARLTGERQREARDIEAPLLAKYDQLLKMRKMLAVASLDGDICSACHVRLRPVVAQHVRRGTEIVTCDSCQRILYAVPKAADAPADAPGAPS